MALCLVHCGGSTEDRPAGVPSACWKRSEEQTATAKCSAGCAEGISKSSPLVSPDSIDSLNLPRNPQCVCEAALWDTTARIQNVKERLRRPTAGPEYSQLTVSGGWLFRCLKSHREEGLGQGAEMCRAEYVGLFLLFS